MCAIAGIIGNPNRELLEKITKRMAHRGPDDAGIWINHRKTIGLGHRRLSIIDIESGHQPMLSADGRFAIVFNGEIYNYIELRKELQDKYKFSTSSDTETLLYHFIEHGIKGLDDLNGMFAFAIWDNKTEKLVLVRDRLGIKPLYYTTVNGNLTFASEIQALIPALNTMKVREEVKLEYFAKKYISAPNTIYEDIYALPAGCCLILEHNKTSITKYWDIPTFTATDILKLTEDEYCSIVEEQLTQAIRLRLRSDVPVGCFLSGGVDSSLITAIAAKESSTPFHTFSVGYKEKGYDESSYANRVAEKYGTIHHHIVLDNRDTEIISKLHHMYGQPFGDASAIPTWYVSNLASRHVKVVLSGDGADEIFGGYTIHLAEYIAERYYRRYVPAFLRDMFSPERLNLQNISHWPYRLRWIAKMFQYASMDTREAYIHLNTGGFHNKADQKKATEFFAPVLENDKYRYLAIKERFINAFLVKVDIASMNNSLEVRSPFLDINLWKLAFQIPIEKHLKYFTRKYILKKIALKYLPRDLVYRKKMGFEVPLKNFFAQKNQKLHDDNSDIPQPILNTDAHIFTWLMYNNWQKDLQKQHCPGKNI